MTTDFSSVDGACAQDGGIPDVTTLSPGTYESFATMTTPHPSAASTETARPILSIGMLSQRIRRQLAPMLTNQTHLIQAQWIKPQANKGQRGFLSVTLADTRNPNIAIDAMIWEPAVIRKVLEQGQQFGHDLLNRDSRVEVVVEATLEYWANKNTIYLLIHKLSTIGMLGLRQQQREAALRTLRDEGLLTRNAGLPWPRFPLRIGIIGKQGSDAAHDILGVLQSSPYQFETIIFHTAVQGIGAIPGLLKAFQAVAAHAAFLDVIVLSRGGGNEMDLVAFDHLDLARAVATASLPVLTGLGHHLDRSICDEVAAKALSTPTAAAQYLVSHLDRIREYFFTTHATLNAHTRHTLLQWTHTLTLTRHTLWERIRATIEAHASASHQARERFRRTLRDRLAASYQQVTTLRYSLTTGLTQAISRLSMGYALALVRLHTGGLSRVDATQAAITALVQTLALSDPQHLLARGYAYLLDDQGRMMTSRKTVMPDARLQIQVQDGRIIANVLHTEPSHEY